MASRGKGRSVSYPGATWLEAHDPTAARLLNTEHRPTQRSRFTSPTLRRARPNKAVQAGRQPFDLLAEEIYCYSLVSSSAFEELTRSGAVGPHQNAAMNDPDLGPEFVAAYDWMRWQMSRRLSGYTGNAPMWVWAKSHRSHLVDMLRIARRISPHDVLLTLRIPREQVLLSHFDEWHNVLNSRPAPPLICPTCGDFRCQSEACWDDWYPGWSDAWDARSPESASGSIEPWWRWPFDLQTELFATWDCAIFDLRATKVVQGCAEELRASWVIDAVRPLGRHGGTGRQAT